MYKSSLKQESMEGKISMKFNGDNGFDEERIKKII
jgi:hypothetical protein